MNLPKGITGFCSINDKELPLMDTIQFKQLSHTFIENWVESLMGSVNFPLIETITP